MSLPYPTVDELVTSVQRSASLPISQTTFQSTDIAAFLDEEQKMTLSQLIHNIREEFWVTYYDQPVLSGVFNYTMPPRAIGGALRDVVFVDASGNEIEITHLAPEQIKNPAFLSYRPAMLNSGYYVKNDQIILWPQTYNNSAYTLRMKYERRPGTLTLSTNCAQVTAVNVALSQVTVTAVPSTIVVNGVVDVIKNTPQFISIADDVTVTAISNSVITLSPFPASIAVGHWICPQYTSCIPQVPLESYSLLTTLGVKRVHMAMQNSNGFQIALKQEQEQTNMLRDILAPRIEGGPQKIVNRSFGMFGYPYFFR